jgi:hypothetical protein
MKLKRDRIFVIVIAVVVANLAYGLISTLLGIALSGLWASSAKWLLVVADVVGIAGALWLLNTYRRGRRNVK